MQRAQCVVVLSIELRKEALVKTILFVLLGWTLLAADLQTAEAASRRGCVGGSCQVRQGGCVSGKCGIRRPFVRR